MYSKTKSPVEGAGTLSWMMRWFYLMYDMYTSGKYQFTKTADFKKFHRGG